VLNALDSQDHDIDYYFPSRLRDEPPGGVDDVHFHVFEPRAAVELALCVLAMVGREGRRKTDQRLHPDAALTRNTCE
jgi:hypothetical protein